MFCSNCGSENPANATSCVRCGQALGSIAATVAPPPPAAPTALPRELATLLGVRSPHIEWGAGAAFLAASILADLVYLVLFPLLRHGEGPALYAWFISLTADLLLTVAALAAFRWVRNDLGAAALAAAGYTVLQTLNLVFLGLLTHTASTQPSFLLYQFVANFLFLVLLALAVRWIQPVWLGLWLGSTAAQFASLLVYRLGTFLSFGSSASPFRADAWDVAQTLLFAAVFAFSFWGALALFAPKVLRE